MNRSDVDLVRRLYEDIKPRLAGHPPEVQGAVLADLLAMWLAGHRADGLGETGRLRENILAVHLMGVRALIPVNDAIIHKERAIGGTTGNR